MKIAIITNHLAKGGITSYVLLAKKAIEDKGHTVVLISGKNNNNIVEPNLSIDIYSKNEFDLRTLFQYKKIARFIRGNGIDIVWAHTRVGQVLAALASKAYCPFITTAHGLLRPSLSRRVIPLWGEKVIAISAAVEDHLRRSFRLKDDKTALVYNAIDTKAMEIIYQKTKTFTPLAKERMGFPSKFFIFGQLARVCRIKGQRMAVKAFDIIARDWPKAGLLFVGRGRDKDEKELEQAINASDFRDRIIWYKGIDDIAMFWSAIDAFLAPSAIEGFGLAAVEAQCLERPVIASNAGGLKEIVVDGKTGIVFNEYTSNALAEKLVFALNNDKILERIAKEGRQTALRLFSPERFADECIAVLNEVVSRKKE